MVQVPLTVHRCSDKVRYGIRVAGSKSRKTAFLPRPLPIGFGGLDEDTVEKIANCKKGQTIEVGPKTYFLISAFVPHAEMEN